MPPDQANAELSRPGDTEAQTASQLLTMIPTDQVTGGLIRDMYSAATRTIRAESYEYWLNNAFLLGEQWVWF